MNNKREAEDKEFSEKISLLKVLIVDDQPDIRMLIASVISELGVPFILEASNGHEALQYMSVDSSLINMIICDWNMPVMNGFDLLKEVRAIKPEIPFVMLTSRNDEGSVLGAINLGVSAYVSKPFKPEQLEKKLRVLLTREPIYA